MAKNNNATASSGDTTTASTNDEHKGSANATAATNNAPPREAKMPPEGETMPAQKVTTALETAVRCLHHEEAYHHQGLCHQNEQPCYHHKSDDVTRNGAATTMRKQRYDKKHCHDQ